MSHPFNAFSSSGISSAALSAALAAKLDKAGGTMTGALTINAGTLATAAFTHQQTWNSGGTQCRGLEVKISNVAAAASSTFFRVCGGATGTTEVFAIDYNGTVQVPNSIQINTNCITQYIYSRAGYIALGASDNAVLQWIAADTIGMKRSTNAQKFRVFGDATKYAQLEHDGTNAKLTASGGNVHISNLPTSNPGPGILWNNAGTPAIGT